MSSRGIWCNTKSAIALVVFSVLVASCGGGDHKTFKSVPPKPSPPSEGKPSARFTIPLPDGATSDPGSAPANGEAYRINSKLILDINAFYEKVADGKPLAGYEWCGGVAFSASEIRRIWTKPDNEVLTLQLTSIQPSGVLIRIIEDNSSEPLTCPPAPPDTGQPPEGSGLQQG